MMVVTIARFQASLEGFGLPNLFALAALAKLLPPFFDGLIADSIGVPNGIEGLCGRRSKFSQACYELNRTDSQLANKKWLREGSGGVDRVKYRPDLTTVESIQCLDCFMN
jgi:hypothetical protein